MNRVALFLGTFDPPHRGHEICLETVVDSGAMEKLGIDKIHMVPAWLNPTKQTKTRWVDRYQMCFKMIAHNDKLVNNVFIDDIEYVHEPSFTYQLFDAINTGSDICLYNNFWWIITEETFKELLEGKWKKSTKLLEENRFILLVDDEPSEEVQEWISEHKSKVEVLQLNESIDVHSTHIRKALSSGECSATDIERTGYVSIHVLNYILREKLYQ